MRPSNKPYSFFKITWWISPMIWSHASIIGYWLFILKRVWNRLVLIYTGSAITWSWNYFVYQLFIDDWVLILVSSPRSKRNNFKLKWASITKLLDRHFCATMTIYNWRTSFSSFLCQISLWWWKIKNKMLQTSSSENKYPTNLLFHIHRKSFPPFLLFSALFPRWIVSRLGFILQLRSSHQLCTLKHQFSI